MRDCENYETTALIIAVVPVGMCIYRKTYTVESQNPGKPVCMFANLGIAILPPGKCKYREPIQQKARTLTS